MELTAKQYSIIKYLIMFCTQLSSRKLMTFQADPSFILNIPRLRYCSLCKIVRSSVICYYPYSLREGWTIKHLHDRSISLRKVWSIKHLHDRIISPRGVWTIKYLHDRIISLRVDWTKKHLHDHTISLREVWTIKNWNEGTFQLGRF